MFCGIGVGLTSETKITKALSLTDMKVVYDQAHLNTARIGAQKFVTVSSSMSSVIAVSLQSTLIVVIKCK